MDETICKVSYMHSAIIDKKITKTGTIFHLSCNTILVDKIIFVAAMEINSQCSSLQ